MIKIIKKQGNSLLIRLDAEDQQIFKLKAGDVIEFDITKVRMKDLTAKDINRESVMHEEVN